ncbi:hypothetical protein TWF696_008355 [Orbilia brochopaga]|uniref:Fungal-type protein kinase domain-containing protein n=1 Tax=Orbilia brochopaga TaxID=3140254 RepID=A0AAV9UJ14_9PEZI
MLMRPPPSIPAPNVDHRTTFTGEAVWHMSAMYMHDWDGFYEEATAALRQISRRELVPDIKGLDFAEENYLVACELGLHAKFIQHISTPLNLAFPKLFGLQKCRFGDFKATESSARADERLTPDIAASIIRSPSDPSELIFVGEIKCFWTLELDQCDLNTRALRKAIGQLGAYMNTYNLKYGCLSTYLHTIFVRRDENYRWSISKPVKSDAQNPSLRECFLFMTWLAKTKGHEFVSGLSNEDVVFGEVARSASSRKSTGQHKTYQSLPEGSRDSSDPKGKSVPSMPPTEKLTELHLSGGSASATTGEGSATQGSLVSATSQSIYRSENVDPLGEIGAGDPLGSGTGTDELPPRHSSASTLIFRDEKTGSLDSCEVLDAVTYKTDRTVYRSVWQGRHCLLKWWDGDEQFAQWRFNNECTVRALLPNNRYIPTIYAAGQVVRGPLKPGFVIIMEKRKGENFSPWRWSRMDTRQRKVFKSALRDAFESFREKDLIHGDAQPNILWDEETETVCVIDWEEHEILPNHPLPPERDEILSIMAGCK